MVRISLDNYESIFAVSPSGIARYLTLLKPVDREEQKSYSFTVRTVTSILSFLDKSPLDMIDINNWAQFDKKKRDTNYMESLLYYILIFSLSCITMTECSATFYDQCFVQE